MESKHEWSSGIWLASGGAIVILIATLYPVEFDPRGIITPFSFSVVAERFEFDLVSHDLPTDLTRNVLLFVPFGFGIALLFHHIVRRPIRSVSTSLAVSLCLSVLVEILQVWYPSRIPSLRDILANGMGGLLGSIICIMWRKQVLNWITSFILQLKKALTVKSLVFAYVGYIMLASFGTIYILHGVKLDGWDTSYRLGVGNELSGDRPWHGTISELHLAARAYSRQQVVRLLAVDEPTSLMGKAVITSYKFESLGAYHDRTGNLPDLEWQGSPPKEIDSTAVAVSEESWLATAGPAGKLSQMLMDSSQFTLITSVAPSTPEQWGAARIVTISRDPSRRNLTLEHVGTDLRVRFRSAVTGSNAMKPVIVVPNLFADNATHRLLITYDGANLSVYVDGAERAYTIALTPEITLLHQLLGTRWYTLRLGGLKPTLHKIFYYASVFVPAGLLVGLLMARAEQQFKRDRPLLLAGILLPVITIETVLASARGIDIWSVLTGLAVIAVVFRASRVWARSFLSSSPG